MNAEVAQRAADRAITLPDRRTILLREYGASGGFPVLALHGTPASRLMYAVAGSRAAAFGLRIIAPDRWGYGGTSLHPRPSLPAFADDIAAVADRLGLARFAVLGVSGGGPYAVGLAARLVDRVAALALVAPVGPIASVAGGVRLTPFHRFCFTLLPRAPRLLGLVFDAFRRGVATSPDTAIRISMTRSPAADHRVMRSEGIRDRFIAMFREGLRPGIAGAVTDMQIFGKPWAVPIERIAAPSALWIGTEDNNVPIPAALNLAAAIPGCKVIELPGEGHLWVALNYEEVLAWIFQNSKGAASATPIV